MDRKTRLIVLSYIFVIVFTVYNIYFMFSLENVYFPDASSSTIDEITFELPFSLVFKSEQAKDVVVNNYSIIIVLVGTIANYFVYNSKKNSRK